MPKLTVLGIKAAGPGLHADIHGLYLRVLPSGARFHWFNGWRFLLAPFLFLVGAVIHLYRSGLAATIEEFDVALSFGLYPPLIFASALFVWNFVCSPPEMERRAEQDAHQQQENLQQKINHLERTIYDREKRQAAIDRLWELRKKGVELRNKEVIGSEYRMWKTEFEAWTEQIYEEAGKISPNLRNWLTILDRVRPPPRLSHQPSGPHHENNRPSGHFPYTPDAFTSQYDNPPLHAYADSSGGNGRYGFSSGLVFPTASYNENYFSDVVFTTGEVPPPEEVETGTLGMNAVYLTIGSGYPPDPVEVMTQTGIKEFTLAFIVSDASGNPKWSSWDGYHELTGGDEEAAINQIRAAGGDVVVSIGGNNENKLGEINTTAAALAARLQTVIDTFAFKAIDYDIEGTELYDSATVRQRVVDALKIIQDNNPSLLIYVTLPGTDSEGVDLIQRGAAAGLNARSWVGMPFGFVPNSQTMGERTIVATDDLKSAVASAYGYDSDTAYRHVGISSMNGQTGGAEGEEVVYLSDFNIMLDYARAHHIGRFTFWDLNRDRQCDGGPAPCSGISQSPYAFTKIIASPIYARGYNIH